MNILVIRFSSMGDVILTTSLFSFLKSTYPHATIYFLTDTKYSGLFKDDSRLCLVVGQEKYGDVKLPAQVTQVVWDRIIDLQNNGRSAAIRKQLLPIRATGVVSKQYGQRLLLLFARMNWYPSGDHVAKRYIRAAIDDASLMPEEAPALMLPVSETVSMEVNRSFFSNGIVRPTIALAPFSAWKNKEWPEEYFRAVGQYFQVKGWNVALLGGPEDAPAAEKLQVLIGGGRCVNLAGRLSLYESACFLSKCSLALGNDSGLSHLARACGVKTGVVFGSTTYHFGFFPYGNPPYRIFQSPVSCRPCHPHGGNFCWLGNRPCLRRIKPELVIRGLENLYA